MRGSAFQLFYFWAQAMLQPCTCHVPQFFNKNKWLGHACSRVQRVSRVLYMSDTGTAAQMPCPCFPDHL